MVTTHATFFISYEGVTNFMQITDGDINAESINKDGNGNVTGKSVATLFGLTLDGKIIYKFEVFGYNVDNIEMERIFAESCFEISFGVYHDMGFDFESY